MTATTAFSDPFLRMTEPHAAWGAQQLEAFNEFMPTGPWTADLDQRLYRQAGRDLRISVLGSFDTSEGSWLWGWANPGFGESPVVGAANEIRRLGEAHGIPEFTTDLVDLSAFDDPRFAVETLAFGAMGALGAAGYLGVQASPEGRLYMVPDDPRVPRAVPDGITLPRVLLTGAGLLAGSSARAVVTGYFGHHGLTPRQEADRVSAELPGGATAQVLFDDAGRIASVEMKNVSG
ncbi:hypothetical protein GCM10011583_06850 [Streptomyces camponoticapitis]|uniref:Uncharacterized protein n=1 Tax=Streptomyces camponoticapitis TaxID=1616125 RepID=A0ABQ2E0P5_9ACTN|nr:DUF6882 domain-containing protein [Streptomyces camponoticapitis]GGJ78012.1 hypothetical protein GCM10011583_06850 [Streptomyces camponoticapitis]